MEKTYSINIEKSVISIGSDFVAVTFITDDGSHKTTSTFLRQENPRLFSRARDAAIKEDYERLSQLSLSILDNLDAIDSRFAVHGGKVFFDGRLIDNFATQKIEELWKANLPCDNWVNFIKNTMANPHAITVEDIYRFLENHEGCPITDDGAILAYKKVDYNYLSFFKSEFTGKREDWSPGRTVELPREHCDPDRNVTCSHGLHFCSRGYAPHTFGGGGRMVMVKIFPQDIVAIPVEYGLAKGRCCKAEVIRDITDEYEEFKFLSSYTADGVARDIEIHGDDDMDVCEFMGDEVFGVIEDALLGYAQSLDFAGKTVTSNIYDLIDRVEKFAASQGNDSFVYDEEDILHVLERSENPLINKMFDIEFESDVFVKISK